MICISHMTALDAEPERMVVAAAKAGFEGVGLRIFPPKHAPGQYPVTGDRPRIRALRALADDSGIRIFEAESFGIGPDFQRDDYLRALEAADALGAGVIVSAGIDDDLDRLAENYLWLAESASRHGIRMAMEFMPYRGMRTLADALRVHGLVGHPNAKLLVDAVHLSRTGADVADLAALPDLSIIGHFHICDAPAEFPASNEDKMRESREARLYPGQGGLPLREMIALLPADCSISLEAPHRDQASWSVEERVSDAGRVTLDFLRAR
jgi:sugar phosphate isomerase/epimerase